MAFGDNHFLVYLITRPKFSMSDPPNALETIHVFQTYIYILYIDWMIDFKDNSIRLKLFYV